MPEEAQVEQAVEPAQVSDPNPLEEDTKSNSAAEEESESEFGSETEEVVYEEVEKRLKFYQDRVEAEEKAISKTNLDRQALQGIKLDELELDNQDSLKQYVSILNIAMGNDIGLLLSEASIEWIMLGYTMVREGKSRDALSLVEEALYSKCFDE